MSVPMKVFAPVSSAGLTSCAALPSFGNNACMVVNAWTAAANAADLQDCATSTADTLACKALVAADDTAEPPVAAADGMPRYGKDICTVKSDVPCAKRGYAVGTATNGKFEFKACGAQDGTSLECGDNNDGAVIPNKMIAFGLDGTVTMSLKTPPKVFAPSAPLADTYKCTGTNAPTDGFVNGCSMTDADSLTMWTGTGTTPVAFTACDAGSKHTLACTGTGTTQVVGAAICAANSDVPCANRYYAMTAATAAAPSEYYKCTDSTVPGRTCTGTAVKVAGSKIHFTDAGAVVITPDTPATVVKAYAPYSKMPTVVTSCKSTAPTAGINTCFNKDAVWTASATAPSCASATMSTLACNADKSVVYGSKICEVSSTMKCEDRYFATSDTLPSAYKVCGGQSASSPYTCSSSTVVTDKEVNFSADGTATTSAYTGGDDTTTSSAFAVVVSSALAAIAFAF